MINGLSDKDIDQLRQQFGYNEIKQKTTPPIVLFLKHFWGLTAWMLEATIIISFLLNKTFDAWVIIALLFFNAAIGFYNEFQASKTVASLQHQLEVTVRVLRNNEWVQIPSRELLPGDVVRIRTGDFLTADMKVLEGNVGIDKSALTGETTVIKCKAGDTLYSGSITKLGECMALVTAIGLKTFFGKTASLILTAKHKMQMELVVIKVVRTLFISVVIILALTTIVGLLSGQSWLSVLPLVLVLLVSAVPVGLPAMFTISMARGSKELAKDGLLVTRLSATEDAATLTIFCIDKTGTITKNELSLQQVISKDGFSKDEVILYGTLASVKEDNDAIDSAFIFEADRRRVDLAPYKQIEFIPFDATSKHTEAKIAMSDNTTFLVAKGSFNSIIELCSITDPDKEGFVESWAHKGFKTIAVAIKNTNDWQMVGIVALYDAPREDASNILAKIKESGIIVKMLTGDALPIGKEIAKEVGIGDKVVSVNDVREKNGSFSENTIHNYDGYAEVLPEDKFKMVKAFQSEKHIVGMTGDGVNDAPALKQAEVGIAVKSATDVARQAASVILLKEGLEQILSLIKVGRGIHIRIANYTVNKIAKTIQTILFVCVAFILTNQFVVSTLDMVMIIFFIDFVVLALSVDKVTPKKKPVNWDMKPLLKKGLFLGFLLFIECMIWFFVAKNIFQIREEHAFHSLGFACLFYSSLLTIPVVRTDLRFYKQPISKTLLWAIVLDAVLIMVLLYYGLMGLSSLPLIVVVSTVFYFLFCNLVLNDSLKIFLLKAK